MTGRILGAGLALATSFLLAAGSLAPAHALEEKANEREALKACEQRLCTMVGKKEAAGEDLSCALSKTWAKDKIKEGIEKKKIDWSLGDARCGISVEMKRSDILGALKGGAAKLEMAKHTVKCEVEREKEVIPINISLAPKIEFKDGKAVKAWLGVSEIEAPAVVKGAIWTAAKMEDSFGLFHSDMIKEINTFIYEKCPDRYDADGKPKTHVK